MEIYLLNTDMGLMPVGDDGYEAKRKLRPGAVYKAKITLPRNYKLHRKYFALINCAWAFLDERQTAFFNESVDGFRKTMEVAAGYYTPVYDLSEKKWTHAPKSIAFDKMGEEEFSELYEGVRRVLMATALKDVSEEEFTAALSGFFT